MRSHSGLTSKYLIITFMLCLIMMCGSLHAYAVNYGDPIDVVVPYTHIYDADDNRTNDVFSYQIEPLDGAPAPQGSRKGIYYFDVDAVPGAEAVAGQVDLKIAYSTPGEYKYRVQAYVQSKHSGFTYETRVYTLHVYVQNASGGGLQAPMVTAVGSNGRKYGRLQFNPSHASEKMPVNRVRPISTPQGDGLVPETDASVEEEAPDSPLTEIIGNVVPKADPERDYWALINLIAAILTIAAAVVMLVRYCQRIDTDEDEYIIRRHGGWRLAAIVPAVVSAITFLLTEDMRLPMELTDEWTLLMLIILAVAAILAAVVYYKYDRDDDDEDGGEPAGGSTGRGYNDEMQKGLV